MEDCDLSVLRVQWIQAQLLSWFRSHSRHFPWRDTTDPYEILIAEKLLQRTAARETVVRAYARIMTDYPSVQTLSDATESELREVLQPLGLQYRSTELISVAREIHEEYGGEIPCTLEILESLTGIGSYTARAILCFAYQMDVPIVDANVARILYRVFNLPGHLPANPARKRSLLDLAKKLLPPGSSRDFNLALVDLGALVCTPSDPDCPVCPLLIECAYGTQRTGD